MRSNANDEEKSQLMLDTAYEFCILLVYWHPGFRERQCWSISQSLLEKNSNEVNGLSTTFVQSPIILNKKQAHNTPLLQMPSYAGILRRRSNHFTDYQYQESIQDGFETGGLRRVCLAP